MPTSHIFTSKMVFQQNQPFTIYGFEPANTKVVVTVINLTHNSSDIYETIANQEGFYLIQGKSYQGSYDPYEIQIKTDNEEQILQDCLFGDCFLLAGQSNMEYSFYYLDDYPKYSKLLEQEKAIRFIHIADRANEQGFIHRPKEQQKDHRNFHWHYTTDTQDFKQMSGLGLLFAYEYHKKHHVPVGLIHTAVGGSSIDSWLEKQVILDNEKLLAFLTDTQKLAKDEDYHRDFISSYTVTSGIYNEKIAPLRHLPLQGVLWYQGENSVRQESDAIYYKEALKTLVQSYRTLFHHKNLPFVAVNITLNYYHYASSFAIALINEAIHTLEKELTNYHAIPTYDQRVLWQNERIGERANPIHPTNKYFIAKRIVEVQDHPDHFPSISDYEIVQNKIVITFKNVGKGLKTNKQQTLRGFNIAGQDLIYHQAQAKILNPSQVEIYSPYIQEPIAFTYAFYLYNVDANLINSYGLPAPIYRSQQDSITKAVYHTNNKFLTCDALWEDHHAFFPLFGISKKVPIYQENRIHSDNPCKVQLESKFKSEGDASLQLNYQIKKGSQYFSVSPRINQGGNHHNLEHFNYLSLDIANPSKTTVHFIGMLVHCRNSVYLFPNLVDEIAVMERLVTNETFKTYTLTLLKVYCNDSTLIDVDADFKKDITGIEFLFSAKESGTIYLDHMELHVHE